DGADRSERNLEGVQGLTQSQIDRRPTWIAERSSPKAGSGWKMPSNEHVAMLTRGAAVWNEWRAKSHDTPDLSGAGVRGVDLSGFDLSGADLRDADLRGTNLSQANLSGAHLERANLFKAVL